MEKVFINPVAKEILIKGNAKEGPVDLFSYDNNGNSRALGNLFVIGNIQDGAVENKDDIDVGYVLNLVASLAKREYYADADASPKDAFSNALKKINGVVEEFFKKKDTKINIGIFAVAGDQIHISKLGKFKILLSRDGKNIDILNNLQLFDKESTQEKEFSNIISGKIAEGDKLLAYYPSRSTIAREKSIKDNLLKSSQAEFAAQLATVKEEKPEFACAAYHIDIQKGTEEALAPRIQPKELQEEKVEKDFTPAAQLATTDEAEEDEEEPEVPPVPVVQTVSKRAVEPAIPRIIPSEFARGKRELLFSKHLRRFKNNMNVTPRIKAYAMGGIAVVAIIAIFSLKSFVFVSAATKQINAAVSAAQTNLKTAQTKISQSDFIGARSLLVSSIASLTQAESTNGSSKKVDDTKSQLGLALDGLDQATDATLNVYADIPTDSGTAKLVTASGATLYTYLDQNGSGAIAKIGSDGTIASSTPVKNISPSAMFSSTGYVAVLDSAAKKITSLSIAKSTVGSSAFSTDDLVNSQIYQDNLYSLTANGIIKVTDAALGKTSVTQWLASGTTLVPNASLITVDGNVYVLSSDGKLTTYFKGKQTNQIPTSVSPDTGSILLTNTNSPNLYLVNVTTGRIYIFAKNTGTVSKTLKINSSSPIISATLTSDDTVYILSGSKIWKVQ